MIGTEHTLHIHFSFYCTDYLSKEEKMIQGSKW